MKKINKYCFSIYLFCILVSGQLFSERLILNPKQILDITSGELYQAQILIEDKIIIKIAKGIVSNAVGKTPKLIPRDWK